MIQILTHVFRAITLVVLMLGIGLTGADAVARELAIVMEPADSWDVDRFRTDLGGMGFTLGPAVILRCARDRQRVTRVGRNSRVEHHEGPAAIRFERNTVATAGR